MSEGLAQTAICPAWFDSLLPEDSKSNVVNVVLAIIVGLLIVIIPRVIRRFRGQSGDTSAPDALCRSTEEDRGISSAPSLEETDASSHVFAALLSTSRPSALEEVLRRVEDDATSSDEEERRGLYERLVKLTELQEGHLDWSLVSRVKDALLRRKDVAEPLKPEVVSALIQSACNAGRVSEAVSIYEEAMNFRNVWAGEVTLTSLTSTLAAEGRCNQAMDLLCFTHIRMNEEIDPICVSCILKKILYYQPERDALLRILSLILREKDSDDLVLTSSSEGSSSSLLNGESSQQRSGTQTPATTAPSTPAHCFKTAVVAGRKKQTSKNNNKTMVAHMDEDLFDKLVEALTNYRLNEKLLGLATAYREREDWHSRFCPSEQTCGLLIKLLGVRRRTQECTWLFQHLLNERKLNEAEVDEEEHTPVKRPFIGEVTFGCILDALISSGSLNEAVRLFDQVKRLRILEPNTIMYATLIKGFAKQKQLEGALAVYEEMKDREVPLNTVTYNSLVDACARVGAMQRATGLLEAMLQAGVEPDLITFSTIVKGYCVQGEVDRAMQLLVAMEERGIKADGVLLNSLLDGCVRSFRLDLCEHLWTRMQSSGIQPSNFTLTILIRMFGRAGQLQRAFDMVKELPPRYGFPINAHVYTCLMSACNANRQPWRGYEVFRQMQRDGIQPDAKTYETALVGLIRWRNFGEALRVAEEAFSCDADVNSTASDLSRSRYRGPPVGFRVAYRVFGDLWEAMRRDDSLHMAQPFVKKLLSTYPLSMMKGFLPPSIVSHQTEIGARPQMCGFDQQSQEQRVRFSEH